MGRRTAHLPPGHKPGPQRRRWARSAPWGPIVCVGFGLGALGGAIALYATRNTGSRSGHEVGAAVFAAGALIMFALGWFIFRRNVMGPPRAQAVDLRVEVTEFRCGAEVPVTLRRQTQPTEEHQLQVGLV